MIDLSQDCRWFSLGSAAKFVDMSGDTINRRNIPWQDMPAPGKLRWKLLKLGEGTRMERRYFRDDLEALVARRSDLAVDTFQDHRWFSLGGAARYLDLSEDTINRRNIPWQEKRVPGGLRWKFLKLGDGTQMERRYCQGDLEALLVLA